MHMYASLLLYISFLGWLFNKFLTSEKAMHNILRQISSKHVISDDAV